MKRRLHLQVNGEDYFLDVDSSRLLSDLLRDELGLMGVKIGCGQGECGTCTVLMNGRAVRSCLLLAGQAEGSRIVTIEGLSRNGLDPLQRAFIDHFAVQCGFCTPGMILMAKALLDENPSPTEGQVREALEGTICRCTGYSKIVDAVLAVARVSRNEKGGAG